MANIHFELPHPYQKVLAFGRCKGESGWFVAQFYPAFDDSVFQFLHVHGGEAVKDVTDWQPLPDEPKVLAHQ